MSAATSFAILSLPKSSPARRPFAGDLAVPSLFPAVEWFCAGAENGGCSLNRAHRASQSSPFGRLGPRHRERPDEKTAPRFRAVAESETSKAGQGFEVTLRRGPRYLRRQGGASRLGRSGAHRRRPRRAGDSTAHRRPPTRHHHTPKQACSSPPLTTRRRGARGPTALSDTTDAVAPLLDRLIVTCHPSLSCRPANAPHTRSDINPGRPRSQPSSTDPQRGRLQCWRRGGRPRVARPVRPPTLRAATVGP